MNKLTAFMEFAALVDQHANTMEGTGKLQGLESLSLADSIQHVGTRTFIGKIYNKIVSFLNDQNMYSSHQFSNTFDNTDRAGRESLNTALSDVTQMGTSIQGMWDLCEQCDIPVNKRRETVLALSNLISRYSAGGSGVISRHWSNDRSTMGAEGLRQMETIYPKSALGEVSFNPGIGNEAFGASIDAVLPDLRMAMTVVMLRPHRGIMSRLMHRRTTAATVVQYIINYDEMYDLTKSMAASGETRNSFDHRIPVIKLYTDPDPANMTLKPIIPRKVNDTANALLADGIIKLNREVDLFDLSVDANRVGYQGHNYTDLVSDGVVLKEVHISLTNQAVPPVTENFIIDTSTINAARLHMMQNTADSGDRGTKLQAKIKLTKDKHTSAGAVSEILAALTGTDVIFLNLTMAPSISLKTAVANCLGHATLTAASTVKDQAVAAETVTLVGTLTVAIEGYTLDAKFSEENQRKTSLAVRSATNTVAYEIPVGRSIIVDYSMQQSVPEHILNVAQEIQNLGIDHRNIDSFMKLLQNVFDRVKMEENDPLFVINTGGQRINNSFVSGQRVNPYVFLGSIDMQNVVSMRSSDMLGDIRQYMESYLNKILSNVHLNSLITQQLDNGEVPTYKVLSSGPIIENLFSVPHIHNHLMPNGMNGERIYQEKKQGEPVEYTRVLPSGTKLECITTTFKYMQNKILMVPFRSGQPDSELNFGHNWDVGTFVAHYTPNTENQVNKRVFQNTREWPIVTCPVGVILDVRNLDKVLPDITVV